MKLKICSLFILSFIGVCSYANTNLIEWQDNIPSSLKPFQNNKSELANLTKDHIIIYAHPTTTTYIPTLKKKPNPQVQFTSSAIVLPVNAEVVEKILSQNENYVGLFPTLKSAKVLMKDQNINQTQYKISIPTPIPALNFNETVIIQHQINKNSISSLIVDAPIPYGVGKFEWFELDQNKTLVTLTQWGDLNQPKGFLFNQILKAIPEAKLGIPSGTHAFILESLRKKLSPSSVTTLKAGQVANDSLTQVQINKIMQLSRVSDYPVSFIHSPNYVAYQHGPEQLHFVSTYQYYAQPIQNYQKWIQPNLYTKLFPRQLKKVDIKELPSKEQLAHFKVSLGLGVINIPFNFQMKFSYPQANQSDFYAQGGDVRFIRGKMQFKAHQEGTLFKMTTAAKIDSKAPFLIRAVRSLPYHDLLPTVGINTAFSLKLNNEQ